MNITVVGTGYVGLVTGTCFAENGNQVVCVDIDAKKVKRMQDGQVPIYEPQLEEFFQRNVEHRRLSFTTSLKEGVAQAEVIFLALPTPSSEDGSADLRHVLAVGEQLGETLDHYAVVVNKSTVPVGTAEKVHAAMGKNAKHPYDVISNPEFLREGFAVADFMKPDRIVIGTNSDKARKIMAELYKPFTTDSGDILFMDERSAEMTKYAANAFLATKITFMNEIANICEETGADVDMVRAGVGSDDRIGRRFLFPGVGYGGSCFPKDVRALQHTAQEHGYDFKILDAVTTVNEQQKNKLFANISTFFKGDLHGKTVAVWGLAFKPDTDDIREAPALTLIRQLVENGARVRATDPEAIANVKKYFGELDGLEFCEDTYKTLEGCDVLAIVTEWEDYRAADLDLVKKRLAQPAIFDGRNLFDTKRMKEAGFFYQSIGRVTVSGH